MARGWSLFYVDRDPMDPYKGWGWIEIPSDDVAKFSIPPVHHPESYKNLRNLSIAEVRKHANGGNLPSRGRGSTKKFILEIDGQITTIRAQKSLTNTAVAAWVKTWAPPNAKLTTPGKRSHSLDGSKVSNHAHFVYFILNEDSNAIKIGRAKDVQRRLKALQTSSPAHLKLIKVIQTDGAQEAHQLEQALHGKFAGLRLAGEWFRADETLLKYCDQV